MCSSRLVHCESGIVSVLNDASLSVRVMEIRASLRETGAKFRGCNLHDD